MGKYDSVVLIPPVDKDTRIGSIFNDIFKIIFQTEQTELSASRKIIWDFSECAFLHPFFICAVSILKQKYGDRVEIRAVPDKIARYFDLVYFYEPLLITEKDDNVKVWDKYYGKTYLPICRFNPNDKSSILAQELIQNAIHDKLGTCKKLVNVISLLFSELIDNITEHSGSKEGFIFSQSFPSENVIYIMICDTGRSIYSSFATNNKYCDLLTDLESSALVLALSGRSTKDLPDCENRGHGISNSIKMVVDGLGGEFFILSGTTFARHDDKGEIVADLPSNIRWNGTAVLLKLPYNVPKDFDYLNYIS